jgi:sulfate adenylyltransferase/3'-phosphoadenosine 5'-phosphosulfate synthase
MATGCVVWLTGLPASGKTSIANLLAERLRARSMSVEILDGDDIRRGLSSDLGFSAEDRQEHNRRVIFVSKLLMRNGLVVLIPLISPFRETRAFARRELDRFVEVYVKCPVEECIRRDPKGLYSKALRGEIKGFTGIDDPYEEPLEPEVTVETNTESVEESAQRILGALDASGYLPGGSPHGGVLVDRRVSGQEADGLREKAAGLPALTLDSRALNDLYMTSIGALSPLTGFMGKDDYWSVLESMRLPAGLPWPLPIVCPVPKEVAGSLPSSGPIALLAPDGKAVALLEPTGVFEGDKKKEAQSVYGTQEEAHPGVAAVYERADLLVGGAVTVFEDLTPEEFRSDNLEPSATQRAFRELGWHSVVGFQTRNPIHRAHEYIQKCALELTDGLLLHPLVGETRPGDTPPDVRMRSYRALLENYFPRDRVLLSVMPAYMRYAGPREAIFHALVRKNYGCTHFVVGRDHAGVGNYYGAYEAQEIFREFSQHELGIQPLFFENAFYCRSCQGMASAKTCPHDADVQVTLSGTQVREMLGRGELPPPEFSRPEVASTLRPG